VRDDGDVPVGGNKVAWDAECRLQLDGRRVGSVEIDRAWFKGERDDVHGVEITTGDDLVIGEEKEEGAWSGRVMTNINAKFGEDNVFQDGVGSGGNRAALWCILKDLCGGTESMEGMLRVKSKARASDQFMGSSGETSGCGREVHGGGDTTIELKIEVLRDVVRNRVKGGANSVPKGLGITFNALGVLVWGREG
jgi:hypothetical protein